MPLLLRCLSTNNNILSVNISLMALILRILTYIFIMLKAIIKTWNTQLYGFIDVHSYV